MIVAVVGVLTGLVMVWRARGARRIDDHPICGRCRFDLVDLAEGGTRCPECGGSLEARNAVRYGNRRLSTRLLLAGSIVALASLGLGGGYAWNRGRTLTAQQWMPEWMLVRAIRRGNTPAIIPELDELRNRLKDRTLSREASTAAARRLLEIQQDPNAGWSPIMGDYLDEAWSVGRLSAEDRATYILNGLAMQVWARPIARRGSRLPVRIDVWQSRLGTHTGGFDLDYRMVGGAVGGVPIDPAPSGAWNEWSPDNLVTAGEVKCEPGTVEVSMEWVFESGPRGSPKLSRTVRSTQKILIVRPGEPLVTQRHERATRRAILAAFAPPQTITLSAADPLFGLTPDTSKLPYPLAVEVWVRDPADPTGKRKWHIGSTTLHPAPTVMQAGIRSIVDPVELSKIDVDAVEVLLVPSPDLAADDWTIVETYGDEIVLKGVRVKGLPREKSPNHTP